MRYGQHEVIKAWTTGHRVQPVAGESHYFADIQKLVSAHGGGNTGELMTAAVLVPEPQNSYDRNAVAVTISDIRVGYLPREDAAPYAAALAPLATQRRLVSVPARIWWGDGGDDSSWIASVSLELERRSGSHPLPVGSLA